MTLGCIADDYTGAADLASMLVRAGWRVVQVFGPESKTELRDADAVVLSLKTRALPAPVAVEESLRALRFLQTIGVERFFFKYCSTFDSTAAGNIGPVAEALADALRVDRIWYCPSFPENGRTVYCGHLFVNRVPLHESGMKDHPLNPMTDSNLVRVLAAQCKDPVDLLPLADVQAGDAGRCSRADAARHWIVDAISDADLQQVARLARDHVLLTGGSAIARFWRAPLQVVDSPRTETATEPSAREVVILAGSCSQATRRQIEAFAAAGGAVLRLDVSAAAAGDDAFQATVSMARSWCFEPTNSLALIASGWDAEAVADTKARLGETRAAELTESLFAAIARSLAARGVSRIVVAGGETSGAVINALEIDAVRIGDEIAPGVPCVYTLREPYLSLVLKSGNFGGEEFFLDAVRKLAVG
jgi:uncharacterized protein YgbK (DUF1537 family)